MSYLFWVSHVRLLRFLSPIFFPLAVPSCAFDIINHRFTPNDSTESVPPLTLRAPCPDLVIFSPEWYVIRAQRQQSYLEYVCLSHCRQQSPCCRNLRSWSSCPSSFECPDSVKGVGARVRRSIGSPNLRNLTPFLMLDHFHVSKGAVSDSLI